MTETHIAASPVSRIQLRNLAIVLRNIFGLENEIFMPVTGILERAPFWFEGYGLEYQIFPKEIFEADEHAFF